MEKEDTISYVAELAQQLADLVRVHLPTEAKVLDLAAALARDALQQTR